MGFGAFTAMAQVQSLVVSITTKIIIIIINNKVFSIRLWLKIQPILF